MPNLRVSVAGGAMPATVLLEFTPAMRHLVEGVIDGLIQLLDEIDGDLDEEPFLAHPGSYYPSEQHRAGHGADDDREEDADFEPSLGSLVGQIDQTSWVRGDTSGLDLEEEHDGREPSLGSLTYPMTCHMTGPGLDGTPRWHPVNEGDQTRWAVGQDARDFEGGDVLDEGEDDTSDREPSLGSLDGEDQTRWSEGEDYDREED